MRETDPVFDRAMGLLAAEYFASTPALADRLLNSKPSQQRIATLGLILSKQDGSGGERAKAPGMLLKEPGIDWDRQTYEQLATGR